MPAATGERYFFFSSSEPARMIGIVPSLLTPGISDDEAHARATSSMTRQVASASAPAPPYSSPMCGAAKSEATRASYAACGNSLLVDLGRVRGDLGVADRADGLADGLVLLGQRVHRVVVHASNPTAQ